MNLWDRIWRFFRSLPYVFRRTKIRVVHEDDLRPLMTSLGIYDDICQRKHHCMGCDKLITLDNLWGILSREGLVHLICSDPECISEIY